MNGPAEKRTDFDLVCAVAKAAVGGNAETKGILWALQSMAQNGMHETMQNCFDVMQGRKLIVNQSGDAA